MKKLDFTLNKVDGNTKDISISIELEDKNVPYYYNDNKELVTENRTLKILSMSSNIKYVFKY